MSRSAAWKATRFMLVFAASIGSVIGLLVFLEPRYFVMLVLVAGLGVMWYGLYCSYEREDQ